MAKVTTLPAMYQPMMGKPSVRMARCAVCGRTWPLEQHHVVFRSAGKMFVEGREIEKPTITLCGFGNHRRLYFRWVDDDAIACAGHWEYIRLDEACDYLTALRMDGWRPL